MKILCKVCGEEWSRPDQVIAYYVKVHEPIRIVPLDGQGLPPGIRAVCVSCVCELSRGLEHDHERTDR